MHADGWAKVLGIHTSEENLGYFISVTHTYKWRLGNISGVSRQEGLGKLPQSFGGNEAHYSKSQ